MHSDKIDLTPPAIDTPITLAASPLTLAASPTTLQNYTNKKQNLKTFIIDYILAAVSASISKTIFYPIEFIKLTYTYQQKSWLLNPAIQKPTGIFDCASKIIAKYGIKGLWHQNLTKVLQYFPTQTIIFALKDFFKRIFNNNNTKKQYLNQFIRNFISGGLAGSCWLFFLHTLNKAKYIKYKDEMNPKKGGTKEFNGLFDVYKKTLLNNEIFSFYKGLAISWIGIVIYRGLYFGVYDTVKAFLPENIKDNLLASFLIGWCTTVGAGLAAFPIDTIRRRMFMRSKQAVKYSGSIHCAQEILANEEVGSFFKGAGVNILRGLAGAGMLALYDKLQMIVFGKEGTVF